MREMLQLLFDDEGHRTVVAADGHKALELAAQGDRAGPRHRRLQPAEGPQRARGHRQAAEAAPARNPGHHPDRRHLDRHLARDRRPRLRASEQAGQGQGADAPVQRLLAKPQLGRARRAQQLPLRLEAGASSTVFVVDDDRAIREAMRDLLQRERVCGGAFRRWRGLPRRPIVQAAKDAFWSMR